MPGDNQGEPTEAAVVDYITNNPCNEYIIDTLDLKRNAVSTTTKPKNKSKKVSNRTLTLPVAKIYYVFTDGRGCYANGKTVYEWVNGNENSDLHKYLGAFSSVPINISDAYIGMALEYAKESGEPTTRVMDNYARAKELQESLNKNLEGDMDSIRDALKSSGNYYLETEVMYTALRAVKEDPDLDIKDAITYGINEWIK